jgi:hypothetical protein
MRAERAAAYLDVSLTTFVSTVAPHVQAIMIGGCRVWDRDALDRWLDQRSNNPDNPDWLKAFDK